MNCQYPKCKRLATCKVDEHVFCDFHGCLLALAPGLAKTVYGEQTVSTLEKDIP